MTDRVVVGDELECSVTERCQRESVVTATVVDVDEVQRLQVTNVATDCTGCKANLVVLTEIADLTGIILAEVREETDTSTLIVELAKSIPRVDEEVLLVCLVSNGGWHTRRIPLLSKTSNPISPLWKCRSR